MEEQRLSVIDDPSVPAYRRLYLKDIADIFGVVEQSVHRMVGKSIPPSAYFEGKKKVWLVGQVREWLCEKGRQANAKAMQEKVYSVKELMEALSKGRLS